MSIRIIYRISPSSDDLRTKTRIIDDAQEMFIDGGSLRIKVSTTAWFVVPLRDVISLVAMS